MFLREFQVIDSAATMEKLRLRLKDNELEHYGSAFTPDFVYEVINRLPRFSSMRRGHQQDAEEFLGFLLEGMHDESIKVIKSNASNNPSAFATPTVNGPGSPVSDSASLKNDTWQEVGPKQRAAVSRSVDQDGSPVTRIFGGKLRSEFRVPGLKDSVTYEPYQPLQLDIGAPNVNNIVDALKALTRSETLHGDFRSPKGPNVTAVKQVFIEEVPPVLILHLKRFQYDNTGGTQKIWKKIGYPLELELPKEVFSRKKRNELNVSNTFPKYRLTGVVYHHGKNASGGHYTVDVRRQDGREWIRLDDTVIRRIRTEDVAGAGSEEDPKVLAAALNAHKNDSTSANPFALIDEDESKESEDEWKQANGSGSVVNGASTPKPKAEKSSIKDNKVAYLLFYQRI
jgi:ubiquitin carboxyl-terminal hydrolase 10